MAAVAASPAPREGGFDFTAAIRPSGRIDDLLAVHFDRLAQWRKDRAQVRRQDLQAARAELSRERAELEDLSAQVADAGLLNEDYGKLHQKGLAVKEITKEATRSKLAGCQAAAAARDRLLKAERAKLEELRAEQAALAQQVDDFAARLAEVDRFLDLYRGRFGMDIQRAAPQTVRFGFTLIDPDDLGREFGITLRLGGSKDAGAMYQIVDCEPPISARRLRALLARLNRAQPSEAAALPAFIVGVRQAFVELVGRPA